MKHVFLGTNAVDACICARQRMRPRRMHTGWIGSGIVIELRVAMSTRIVCTSEWSFAVDIRMDANPTSWSTHLRCSDSVDRGFPTTSRHNARRVRIIVAYRPLVGEARLI